MLTRTTSAGLLLCLLEAPAAAAEAAGAAQSVSAQPARRVLVVSPTAGDPRILTVREAIAFWSDTFSGLGLAPALVDAGVAVAPPGTRALENFAWQISRAAGRLPEGTPGPPPPPELLALDGDIVVLLSAQPLLPFAWPLPGSTRYLIAIAAADDALGSDRGSRAPSAAGRDARDIVVHELGHVLGLRHGADPAALMCEPCSSAPDGGEPSPRSLSAADRARLIELYGSPPGPQ